MQCLSCNVLVVEKGVLGGMSVSDRRHHAQPYSDCLDSPGHQVRVEQVEDKARTMVLTLCLLSKNSAL